MLLLFFCYMYTDFASGTKIVWGSSSGNVPTVLQKDTCAHTDIFQETLSCCEALWNKTLCLVLF